MTDTALVRMTHLQTLPVPDRRELSSLRTLLQTPEYGNNFLSGSVEDVWEEDKGHSDYVQLGPESNERDLLTTTVAKGALLVRRRYGRRTRTEINRVSDATIVQVANTISSILASSIPVIALSSLYMIEDLRKRLWMILAFTVLFSLILLTTTRSRRVEIYAATVGSVEHPANVTNPADIKCLQVRGCSSHFCTEQWQYTGEK